MTYPSPFFFQCSIAPNVKLHILYIFYPHAYSTLTIHKRYVNFIVYILAKCKLYYCPALIS